MRQSPWPSSRRKEEKIPDLQGDPSDRYFEAWLGWKEGERLQKDGKLEDAKGRYSQARLLFKGIQKKWPDWKKDMVGNRIRIAEETRKSLEAGRAGGE